MKKQYHQSILWIATLSYLIASTSLQCMEPKSENETDFFSEEEILLAVEAAKKVVALKKKIKPTQKDIALVEAITKQEMNLTIEDVSLALALKTIQEEIDLTEDEIPLVVSVEQIVALALKEKKNLSKKSTSLIKTLIKDMDLTEEGVSLALALTEAKVHKKIKKKSCEIKEELKRREIHQARKLKIIQEKLKDLLATEKNEIALHAMMEENKSAKKVWIKKNGGQIQDNEIIPHLLLRYEPLIKLHEYGIFRNDITEEELLQYNTEDQKFIKKILSQEKRLAECNPNQQREARLLRCYLDLLKDGETIEFSEIAYLFSEDHKEVMKYFKEQNNKPRPTNFKPVNDNECCTIFYASDEEAPAELLSNFPHSDTQESSQPNEGKLEDLSSEPTEAHPLAEQVLMPETEKYEELAEKLTEPSTPEEIVPSPPPVQYLPMVQYLLHEFIDNDSNSNQTGHGLSSVESTKQIEPPAPEQNIDNWGTFYSWSAAGSATSVCIAYLVRNFPRIKHNVQRLTRAGIHLVTHIATQKSKHKKKNC